MRPVPLALLVTLASCARAERAPPPPPPPAEVTEPARPPTPPPRPTAMDVTFLVVSDTHFGYEGIERTHELLVSKMSSVAGARYPRGLPGEVVAMPRGLLITGDLTEWGRPEQWDRFVAWYGDGGPLRLPVFETVGNHDKVEGAYVEAQVARRHGGRFYSWDWDALHLVALGEAPDDEGLAFLERDLAALEADVPVVLFFHLPLAGAFSTDRWFGAGDFRDRLARAVVRRNVVGIFHGHHHARGHYVWNGIDVYKPGAVKDDGRTFAVVHLTRSRMTVAWRAIDRDGWAEVHDKTLVAPRSR